MSKRYSKEIREEVLEKVRQGKKVSTVSHEYGINDQTIRNWLERDTDGNRSEILELSRLRRENEALLRLVGQLTYESETQKKNRQRAIR